MNRLGVLPVKHCVLFHARHGGVNRIVNTANTDIGVHLFHNPGMQFCVLADLQFRGVAKKCIFKQRVVVIVERNGTEPGCFFNQNGQKVGCQNAGSFNVNLFAGLQANGVLQNILCQFS